MPDRETEWFQSTSSKVWGGVSLVLAVAVMVVAIVDFYLPVLLGAFGFGLLAYASMLRPKIGLNREDLLIRNMYSSYRIPLPAIDSVAITRTFSVHVLGKTYVSPAIGRSFREISRYDKGKASGDDYASLVERRIDARIADARAMTGVAHGSDEQVALADSIERHWSLVEVGLLVATVVALVIAVAV